MSLYTKYRPKDWNSVIWQHLIVKILQTSLQENSAWHAYIFTGSRGTGKTTSARIFAKSLNCENLQNWNPCHSCQNCMAFDSWNMIDIIEIDGASNALVDDIRALIEEAKFLPVHGKFKVYIIDEVHMLGKSAFNALLKIIEEPPAHIKFILATTEIHKVPETIRSRSQRFDFQKISTENIIERLKFVCEQEKISYDNESLQIIAEKARGGMRDALTILEQYSINNALSWEYLKNSLSYIDKNFISEIIETLRTKNFENFEKIFTSLKSQHIDGENFFEQMIFWLHEKMQNHLQENIFSEYNAIFNIFREAYSSLKILWNHSTVIEITLMQAINWGQKTEITTENILQTPKNTTKSEEKIFLQEQPKNPAKIPEVAEKISISEKNSQTTTQNTENILQKNPENTTSEAEKIAKNTEIQNFSYRKLLDTIGDPVALATLRTGSFKQKDTHLDLIFSSKWNADKMRESRYTTAIISALEWCFWGNWTLNIIHQATPPSAINFVDDVF